MKVGTFKQVLCTGVVSTLPEYFIGIDITSGWGTLPLPGIVKPKPVEEVLTEATVRNVMVDGIKVNVCRRIGMFEPPLCEVVVSLLPDCIMGMDVVSDWGTLPLPNIEKQKACESTLPSNINWTC